MVVKKTITDQLYKCFHYFYNSINTHTLMKKHLFIILAFVTSFSFSQNSFRLNPLVTENDYRHGEIIMKFKPEYRNTHSTATKTILNTAFQKLGIATLTPLFPHHSTLEQLRIPDKKNWVDLTLIYKATYTTNASIEKAINTLLATGLFQYAEPDYIYQTAYVPNDTLLGNQWHHSRIQSLTGWDIQKGDTNVIIGYTDSGFDINHPELTDQIKYNYADPVNGIDDDGDGYTDNYSAWSVASNSNDVSVSNLHGTFVAGIGSAKPDNVFGIAGVGYNSKILLVGCSPGNNTIVNGDLAIIYAADKGASVINCSWGGFGSSQFSQDAVNYATFNKNALVVGSAGNAANDAPFYPASYQYVLSVSGVDSNDVKWTGSSYGSYVDIAAGGDRVYSIFPGGPPYVFSVSGGTSESAPMISGAAALVKAQFPTYTGLQVGERLRVTADNVDGLPGNAAYVQKLGRGRLNVFRALTEPATSVRAHDFIITDNNDNAFTGNDTLRISHTLVNYLDAVNNLTVTLSSNQPLINILNNTWNVGAMATLDADSNRATPFEAVIDPAIPRNTRVVFTLSFTDGSYTDYQKFEVTVNVDYINVLVNDVGLTITSKGRLGFNDAGNSQGIGFTYNEGDNLLYGGGLVVGIRDTLINDCTFGTPAGSVDNDFAPVEFVKQLIPSVKSDFDVTTTFNDSVAIYPLPVLIKNDVFAWGSPADRKYIISRYTIYNTGTITFDSLYAGILADWDLTAATYATNRAEFDAANKMGYAYEVTNNNHYVGVKLLSGGNYNYYAINNDGGSGSINVYDGLTKPEKFQAFTTPRLLAGAGAGADISMMLATGPFTVVAGDSVTVAFAFIGGDSLADLALSAVAAQTKFDNLNSVSNGDATGNQVGIYPNPFTEKTWLKIESAVSTGIKLLVTDVAGRSVLENSNLKINAGKNMVEIDGSKWSDGIYFYNVITDSNTISGKIVKQ